MCGCGSGSFEQREKQNTLADIGVAGRGLGSGAADY
jgi:hypothetical protein